MATGEATNWVPISELETGFGENKLPATGELSGKELLLYFPDNKVIRYIFHDAHNLTWESISCSNNRKPSNENYESIRINSDIYFVDLVKKKQPKTSVSIVMDMNKKRALVITTTVPGKIEARRSLLSRMSEGLDLSPMKVEILQASINKPFSRPNPKIIEKTGDLIGKRVQYIYSSQHTYEHIYLNNRFYCWQCLRGPEKGTADTDMCDYFKLAPHIYVFVWREKIVPTAGVVLINFKDFRSSGKIFGLDISSGKAVNFTMGAYVKIINEIN